VNLLNCRRRKPPTYFGQGGVFPKAIYVYYSTLTPAQTTTPHYMDGDRYTQYLNIPHSSTLAKIFLSVFYILT